MERDEGQEATQQGGAKTRAQLFVLQSISSRLIWTEQGCTVVLEADAPGSREATEALRTNIRVFGKSEDIWPDDFVLWVRVPG